MENLLFSGVPILKHISVYCLYIGHIYNTLQNTCSLVMLAVELMLWTRIEVVSLTGLTRGSEFSRAD